MGKKLSELPKITSLSDNDLIAIQPNGNENLCAVELTTLYNSIESGNGSSSNPGNSGNLTNTGTILYDVSISNANYGIITLNQSAANFTKLDICACTDIQDTIFTSVYNPNNSTFNIQSFIQEGTELLIKSKQYEILELTITPVSGFGGMCSISSAGVNLVSGDYTIGIYKVIGY